VGARAHWLVDANRIPTGQTEPTDTFFEGDRHAVPLNRFATRSIDDTFSDLERDAQGRGKVTIKGIRQSLTVTLGPKFKTILVFSTVPGQAQVRAGGQSGDALQPPLPPPVSTGPPVPLSATDAAPSPSNRGFVALEPMAGIPNSMNAAYKGLYRELQSIEPGGSWQESFWVSTSGF
jgi:galactose mutarotase-like enzyme